MRNLKKKKVKRMTPQSMTPLIKERLTVKSHSKPGALPSAKNPIAKTVSTKKGVMPRAVSDILFSVLGDIIMSYLRSSGFYTA